MFHRWILLFFLLILVSPSAWAMTNCEYFKEFMPSMYNLYCSKGSGSGGGSSKPAGASSTFADSFNVSPAGLPVETSPYGVEFIGSVLLSRTSQWVPTFAIVKGFHRFGTGLSTSSTSVFYGNDIIGRAVKPPTPLELTPYEKNKTFLPNLNLGTSFLLFETKGFSTQLGVSVRHNGVTDTWGGGPGLMMSFDALTLGAGFTRERVTNYFGPVNFTSYLASVKLFGLELEYIMLRNYGGISLDPIHILTLNFGIGKALFSVAARELNYLLVGRVIQPHFAIQYSVTHSLSLGALYNYIPGTASFAFQYFL